MLPKTHRHDSGTCWFGNPSEGSHVLLSPVTYPREVRFQHSFRAVLLNVYKEHSSGLKALLMFLLAVSRR